MRKAVALLLLLAFAAAAEAADFPPGRIRVSPGQDLEQEVTGFIGSAIRHVYVFSERIELPGVVDALIKKRNFTAVPVRLVVPVDGLPADLMQNLSDGRVEFRTAGGSAGFSGTSIVVDGVRTMLIPSGLTYAALHTDRNHTFIVDNHLVTDNYVNEFNEMFLNASYGSGSPATLSYPRVEIAPAFVETYFTPENDPSARLGLLVDVARTSLRLTCRTFNSTVLATKFKAKRLEGIPVTIVVDAIPTAAFAAYEDLRRAGIDILVKDYPLDLAHILEDVLVIDDRYTALVPPSFPEGTAFARDAFSPLFDATATAAFFGARHDQLVARILSGVTLRGQVTDSSTGEPVPDAKASVVGTATATWTDKYGFYSFKNLATGEIQLEIEKAAFFTLERRLAVSGTQRTDFTLKPLGVAGAVRGRVTDSVTGAGIAGIELVSRYIETGSGIQTLVRTRSGPDGNFKFELLPPGTARIVAETAEWVPNDPVVVTVVKNETLDLERPIVLRPRFLISVMPNPIYPANLFVTLQTATHLERLPDVTVTQKDWIPVAVPMQRLVSSTRETDFFGGNYRIEHGYFGEAVVEVNRGEARTTFTIGFIEAGSRYTFYAPNGAAFDLTDASGADALLTATGATFEHGNPELAPAVARGIDLAGPGGVRFAPGSMVLFPDPGKGGLIYKRDADNRLLPVETVARDGRLAGKITGAGTYFALVDGAAPKIQFRPEGILVTDGGSGVAPDSLAVVAGDDATGDTAYEFAARATEGGWLLVPRKPDAILEWTVTATDRVGNPVRATGRPARAPGGQATLAVYPNPVNRASAGVPLAAELRLPAPARARFAVRDAAGRKLFETTRDTPAAYHRFTWDLRDRRGRAAANGTYFITTTDPDDAGAVTARAKFSILK